MCEELPLFRRWWMHLPSRVSEKTAKTYRYWVTRAMADLKVGLLAASPAQLDRYLDRYQPRTLNVLKPALADYYDFAMRAGVLDRNPIEKTKPRRMRRRHIRRALSREELTRLCVAAVYLGTYRRRWTGERTALLFLAQYYLGLRPGELIRLRTTDVTLDSEHPRVVIVDTKTGYDRIVPLSETAAGILALLAEGREGFLTHIGRSQYWQRFRNAALVAGVDPARAHPYVLRHSSATHMLEHGVSLRVVADVLGHVDTRHTAVYTVPSEDDRWRAVAAL